jgi:hypothetical protein
MTTASQKLRREVAALSRRVLTELPNDFVAKFAAAQVKADPAYRALGHNGAPARQSNETFSAYRRRLMAPLQRHSKALRKVELLALPPEALGIAQAQNPVRPWLRSGPATQPNRGATAN